MLIGSDCIEVHRSLKEVIGDPEQPIARLTPLGWKCVGKMHGRNDAHLQSHFIQTFFGNVCLEDQIKRFWEIEEITNSDIPISTVDKRILQESKNQLVKDNGRFVVKIPWNEEKTSLHGKPEVAKHRLETLNNRLNKDEQLKNEYDEIIRIYQEKHYIREVPGEEKGETKSNFKRRDKQPLSCV